MPRPKGLPKTGGRQKGAANKRTREIADRAATDAGLLPLDYMLSVVRDPAVEPERRDRMAVAAAPFVHARLGFEAGADSQVEVLVSRAELAEQAASEIDEAFREWQPPGHEEARANGPVIEHRSSPDEDGDRSEPAAEADGPALPVPRDFARPGSVEAVPGVARRIPRRPRPVRSSWAS